MTGFRAAVAFLTVVPAGAAAGDARARQAAVPWYPAVGLAIGAALALLALPLDWLWPPLVRSALLVAVWTALTGALHLDGLADCADAACAPVGRERRLAILRDVHHGTFAVAAVALVLLVEVSVLAGVDRKSAAAMVLLGPVVGRAAIAPAMRAASARSDGMGAEARTGASSLALLTSAALAAAAALFAFGVWGLIPLAAAGAASALTAWWLSRRFGGLTGDCYGAIVVMAEAAALLAASATLARGGAQPFPWVALP